MNYFLHKLPVEILQCILEEVANEGPTENINSTDCRLVCRLFANCLRPRIFRHIDLLASPGTAFKTCEQFLNFIQAFPLVPNAVKTLGMRQGYYTDDWTRVEGVLRRLLPTLHMLTELSLRNMDIPESTPLTMLTHITSLKLTEVSFAAKSPVPFISSFSELQHLYIDRLRTDWDAVSPHTSPTPVLDKLIFLEVAQSGSDHNEIEYLNRIVLMFPKPSKLKKLIYPWVSREGGAPQHHLLADNAPDLEELILTNGTSRPDPLPSIPRVHGRALKKLTLEPTFRTIWTDAEEASPRLTLEWLARIFSLNGKEETCTLEEVTIEFCIVNIMWVVHKLEKEWTALDEALAGLMNSTLKRVTLSFVGCSVSWHGTKKYCMWDILDEIERIGGLFSSCAKQGQLEVIHNMKSALPDWSHVPL